MAIGGVDFLLRKFQQGEEDEKVQAAEHLLLGIRAEGSCRNYVRSIAQVFFSFCTVKSIQLGELQCVC
jgi:hypothetical protein